jgi:hypothetical protein
VILWIIGWVTGYIWIPNPHEWHEYDATVGSTVIHLIGSVVIVAWASMIPTWLFLSFLFKKADP